MNEKGYYTVKEFAKLTGLHPNTIRKSIKNGKLGAFKINENTSSWRIPVSELDRMVLLDSKMHLTCARLKKIGKNNKE